MRLLSEIERARHRQLDDLERPAVLVGHRSQAAAGFPASGSWLASLRIRLDHGDDRARPDEARQIVDVAVRVVADDAVAEPENFVDPKVVRDSVCSDLLACHAGIALLHAR